jgi:hypothetical protein
LGSEQDAGDDDFLQSHNIDYVVNLSLQIPKPPSVKESHFLRIAVHDSPNEKMLPHFLQAFHFLGMYSVYCMYKSSSLMMNHNIKVIP